MVIDALKSLFPDGHAFRFFSGKQLTLFIEALAIRPEFIKSFFIDVRDSGIPGQIPSDALTDWEQFYNLQNTSGLSDAERNARIKAKYDRVGGQGPDYLQDTLRDEFDLFLGAYIIYTATCGNPVITCAAPNATCGSFLESDDTAIITVYPNPDKDDPRLRPGLLIIRDIDDDRDELPDDSTMWPLIWLISGPDGRGSWLEMDLDRKLEFVKSVLEIKPVNSWVIAQINFV